MDILTVTKLIDRVNIKFLYLKINTIVYKI